LQQSRDEFIAALKLLTQGGQATDVSLPPTSDAVKPQLDALTKEWEKTDRSVQLVLAQSKNLIGLATAVRLINTNNPCCSISPSRSRRSNCSPRPPRARSPFQGSW